MVPKYFEFRGKELNLNPNPDTRFISVLVRHICRLCVSWYPVYLMAEQIIDTDITVMAAAPAPGPGHRAAHWSCTPLNLARAQLPCTSAANHTSPENSYTSTFLTNHRNTFPRYMNASGMQLYRYSNGFPGKIIIYA